jgi:hypothetical protein
VGEKASKSGRQVSGGAACGKGKQKIELALIKKKIKFSSYIRKFRVEQLQSHI